MRNINYKMCKQCEINPVYEFTNKRRVCGNCFINYFNKKALYIIRKFELIKKGEVIGYKNKGNFRDAVLDEILKIFSKKSMNKIVKLPSKKKITKIAIASTIDIEEDRIIHSFVKDNFIKNKNKFGPIEKKEKNIFIKPLYLFLDKEVLLYAKLKKLKFKKEKIKKKDNLSLFIENLEDKHPEVKRAIVKSYLKLFNK